jgi:uncharacterized protein DUF4240
VVSRLDWDELGDDDKVVEPAVKALAAMPEAEIAAFQNTLTAKLFALDGRAWARESGELIWWGEDDFLTVDGFLYARCVVVANGQEYFDAVLSDPSQMPKDVEFESLLLVAPTAYERKTGRSGDEVRDLSDVSYETFSNSEAWQPVAREG